MSPKERVDGKNVMRRESEGHYANGRSQVYTKETETKMVRFGPDLRDNHICAGGELVLFASGFGTCTSCGEDMVLPHSDLLLDARRHEQCSVSLS